MEINRESRHGSGAMTARECFQILWPSRDTATVFWTSDRTPTILCLLLVESLNTDGLIVVYLSANVSHTCSCLFRSCRSVDNMCPWAATAKASKAATAVAAALLCKVSLRGCSVCTTYCCVCLSLCVYHFGGWRRRSRLGRLLMVSFIVSLFELYF